MHNFKSRLLAVVGLVTSAGLFCAGPAVAGPVNHFGAIFEVTGTFDGTAGVTKQADFEYTADFTKWNPGTSGLNPIEYIIAVEFNLTGNKVMSVDSFSTNTIGTWDYGASNSSNNNGCGTFGSPKNAACAEDLPFDEATNQQAAGMLWWKFSLTFKDVLASDSFTKDDNHIGAFFRKCSGAVGDRSCTGGLGLSQSVSFNPTDPPITPDPTIPAPGTLLLLGLGLFGLSLSRKKAH